MNDNYTVYCHTHKSNGKKYIGITKQRPERRWQKGKGYTGTRFGNAILKYGWDAFTHEILYTNLSKSTACEIEIDLISKFKTQDRKHGYNVSIGGETTDSITCLSGINHPNHKRVNMIDCNTKQIIKTFDSQSDAAKELNVSRKCITKACQGLICVYKGYIWEYADYDFLKPKHNGIGNYIHSKQNKPIIVIETDGTTKTFESIKKASETLNIKRSNISRYLTGIRKDACGRRWCYA